MAAFDHSRMMLIDVRDENRPPFVVLTSQDVLDERPELKHYQVTGREDYNVWAGNDPAALYLSFPDEATFLRVAGDPKSVALDTMPFSTEAPVLGHSDLSQVPAEQLLNDGSHASVAAEATSHSLEIDDVESSAQLGPVASEVSVTLGQLSAATSSSQWTGRRSPEEQVRVVMKFAPLAQESVNILIAAIEEKRLNDPQTNEAIAGLRELHEALGALIALAQRGAPLEPVWEQIESSKGRVVEALKQGAKIMVVAPIVALGTATILGALSGFTVSENMVTALCAAQMGADAFLSSRRSAGATRT
jgi:hypothetical protein